MPTRRLYHHPLPFALESGAVLQGIDIAYHTYGTLNHKKSNVIWVCHALTGSSDAATWWPGLIGSNKLFDPDRYFIVCANVLGSPYGSTNPQSIDPVSGAPYLLNFPLITIRDIVNAHRLLSEHLGIEQIYLLIGGSLGGQQALEWSIMQSERIDHAVILAANAVQSPWGIAFNESQRLALLADSSFDGINPKGGSKGLSVARSIAMLSYRTFNAYQDSQSEQDSDKVGNFLAATYQQYQGEKFTKRFDAYSYWSLINTIDTHNVGRKRGHVERELQTIVAKTLVIAILSDLLFPDQEQRYLAQYIPDSKYVGIESVYGHDGFLMEDVKLGKELELFLAGSLKTHSGMHTTQVVS